MRSPSFFAPHSSASPVSVPSSEHIPFGNIPFGRLLQEIFAIDGGERVFRAFGFEIGNRYISPFRSDAKHKNFSVFTDKHGRVFFKDFAAGDGDNASGNFLTLLQHYGYRDFAEQIAFAAPLYGYHLKDKGLSATLRGIKDKERIFERQNSVPLPSVQRVASVPKNSYRITALETAPFNDEERSILAQLSGGYITEKILADFGARALRSYAYNGVNKSGTTYNGTKYPHFTLVVPSADGNWYGYCYYKADTYSTFPNSAKNFHLKFHDYTSDVKFALGVESLRPNEAAYIVEGVKDVFIAKALGLNAFTLGGVQTRLPERILERLRTHGNTLAICFDTDFAGISSAQKLADTLNTQHSTLNTFVCRLPRLERQETKDAPKPAENDLADYIVRYGYDDELRSALTLPLVPERITLSRGSMAIPAEELRITKHCAESPATIAALERAIAQTPRLFLSAPTGSGKTFCLLNHIALRHHERTGGRTLFVVPTIALAEQIEQEYRHLPLISITGNDTALSLLEARTSSKIIVCTADSVPKILYRTKNASGKNNSEDNASKQNAHQMPCLLDEENILLIVDEAHKVVSDYGYRDAAMRGVMTAMERVSRAHCSNRVVCVSATPTLFFHHAPEQMRFDYLALRADEQTTRSLALCPYLSLEQEAVNTILCESKHGAVVVRINNERALATIQKLLLHNGMNADEIDIITSRRRTTSPEYNAITTTSRITRRVILTTALLDCGVNITSTDIRAVLLFDERDPATIVQFVSRFRCARHVRILLFYKQSNHAEQQHLFPLSPVQMFQSNLFQAEMRARDYNTSPHLQRTHERSADKRFAHGKNLHSAIGKKSAFTAFDHSMMFDDERKEWKPDLAGIIAHLEKLRITMRTRAELCSELEEYGIRVVERANLWEGTETELTTHTMVSAGDVAALTAQAKEQAKQEKQLLCTMLAEAPKLLMEAVYHTTRSKITRSAITALFPSIAGKPQERGRSEECSKLLRERADLFSTNAPETFALRYLDLRRKLFDHDEASTLVERCTDARVWARFNEHLAMHQRLELKRLHLHTKILTPHDRKKLERECEVRNMVANAASVGFVFHGTTGGENAQRHIPFALHRADDIALRVNAFTDTTFRLTKQRAGELVNALFIVSYNREREVQDNGTVRFGGYYTFAHNDEGIHIKTLAEFLAEWGVSSGTDYQERFSSEMQKAASPTYSVCAVSLL